MAEMIRLTARDGHQLDAWLARPAGSPRGAPRGAVVVAQEMYGITDYLKSVCSFYAEHGYLTIAPALYDRRERNLVLAYNDKDHDLAQELYTSANWDLALDDLDAGRAAVSDELGVAKKIAIVGFCWGGSLAWLAACRRTYDAAVAYYGSAMPDYADERARCPIIAHIGDQDRSLPPDRVAAFRAAQPKVPVHIYSGAPHGFDNPMRPARYHAEACKLARARTLDFLADRIDHVIGAR